MTYISTTSAAPAPPRPPKAGVALPGSTYMPTKAFVKASGKSGSASTSSQSIYDPSNSTMKLHEIALSNHIMEVYEKIEGGLPNGLQGVRLILGQETYTGTGVNLKAAKQDAAKKALEETKLPKPIERKTLKPRPLGITATQELHELATKKGQRVTFKFLEPANFEFKASMRMWTKQEMLGNYRVQLTVGELEFVGHADLPQQAKHNAAVQALPYLNTMPDVSTKTKKNSIVYPAVKPASATASNPTATTPNAAKKPGSSGDNGSVNSLGGKNTLYFVFFPVSRVFFQK